MNIDTKSSIGNNDLDPDPFTLGLAIVAAVAGVGSLIIAIGNSFDESHKQNETSERTVREIKVWLSKADKNLLQLLESISHITTVLNEHDKLDAPTFLGEANIDLSRANYALLKDARELMTKASLGLEECLTEMSSLLSNEDQDSALSFSFELAENFDEFKSASTVEMLLRVAVETVEKVLRFVASLADNYGYTLNAKITRDSAAL